MSSVPESELPAPQLPPVAPQVVRPDLASVIVWGLCAVLGGAILVAFMMPVTRTAREPARRSQCKNNFKQIGLALHNYYEQWDAFPPAYTVDANGYRLHSWRTLILPYLDQKPLYDRIDLTKAWDDPVNAELCRTPLSVYQCPSTSADRADTQYMAIVGAQNVLNPAGPRPIDEIPDGTSSTVMVIEVDSKHVVPWASPLDADEDLVLSFNEKSTLSHIGGLHGLFADGSVQFLSITLTADQRRAMMTIAGHETAEIP